MPDDPTFDDLGHRQCRRCQAVRPLQEFPASLRANGSVKFGSYCPPCQKAYQHEWYLAHRQQALAAAAARRDNMRSKRPEQPEPRPLAEAIGFSTFPNPRKQGNAGLGIAIAYLTRLGVDVAIPLTDTQRYDLVIVHDEGMERVQVKTTTMRQGNSYFVGLATIGGNKTQTKARKFDPTDYEWLFVVCGDATAYMIPSLTITTGTTLLLSRRYERYRLQD